MKPRLLIALLAALLGGCAGSPQQTNSPNSPGSSTSVELPLEVIGSEGYTVATIVDAPQRLERATAVDAGQ